MFDRFRVEIEGMDPLIIGDEGKNTVYDRRIDLGSLHGKVSEIRYTLAGYGLEEGSYDEFYSSI